ncbi:GNAT family N-acetyltransferase [Streptomyces boninensis]|uniref:GNAT family N-acetyltransferase n=1 Tax=Streptomyces boninensis TaxID=2039455 RepID=UPI003B21BC7D
MTPALRTARLDLLPLAPGHATEMAAVLADPALHRYTGGTPAAPADLAARYERLAAGSPDPGVTWHNWVLLLRAEARLTGYAQATVTAAAAGRGRSLAEVAWVVGTPWQGQGIAKEAAQAVVHWLGTAETAIAEVIAHIHPDHHASAAIAAAAGLAPTDEWQEGEIRWRRKFPAPDGSGCRSGGSPFV